MAKVKAAMAEKKTGSDDRKEAKDEEILPKKAKETPKDEKKDEESLPANDPPIDYHKKFDMFIKEDELSKTII